MLRSTNTGLTAIINERGNVLDQIEIFTSAGLHGSAQGFSGATPYVKTGNYLILILAGAFLGTGLIASYRVSRNT